MKKIKIEKITSKGGYLDKIQGTNKYYTFAEDYHDLDDAYFIEEKGQTYNGNSITIFEYPTKRQIHIKNKSHTYITDVIYQDGLKYLEIDLKNKTLNIIELDEITEKTKKIHTSTYKNLDEIAHIRLASDGSLVSEYLKDTEEIFKMYYPMEIEFKKEAREAFDLIDLIDEKLYFGNWYENEENRENGYEYYETIVVRNTKGEKIEEKRGSLIKMPNEEYWII